MIVCEKCGGDSGVHETKAVGKTVRRRRRCKKCNYRWTTIEICIAALCTVADAVKEFEKKAADA